MGFGQTGHEAFRLRIFIAVCVSVAGENLPKTFARLTAVLGRPVHVFHLVTFSHEHF